MAYHAGGPNYLIGVPSKKERLEMNNSDNSN